MEEEARLPPPHSTSESDGKVLRRAFRFSVATAMLSWKLQPEALGGSAPDSTLRHQLGD